MNPTINQQLRSIKLRLEETIIPELKAGAAFAKEQAAFIVMSLDWMLTTHEHQYRYAVVENTEYRDLLHELTSIDDDINPLLLEVKFSLSKKGPAADEAIIPLAEIDAQTREFKRLTAKLFQHCCNGTERQATAARNLLKAVSRKQGDRELALFEGTGFAKSENRLGAVLGETIPESDGSL